MGADLSKAGSKTGSLAHNKYPETLFKKKFICT